MELFAFFRLSRYAVILFFLSNSQVMFAQSWDQEDYNGKRCGLLLFRDVSIEENKIAFSCDVANTGKVPLNLNGKVENIAQVVFSEDGSLEKAGLGPYKDLVAIAVSRSKLDLDPGEFKQSKRFSINRTSEQLVTLPVNPSPSASNHEESETGFFYSDTLDGCPDIVIDSLWILREKRSGIEIGFRILNKGTGPARFYSGAKEDKGTDLSFYLGNTPVISRSSQFIYGFHIDSGLDTKQGILDPGHTLVQTITIPSKKRPSYLNSLLCRIDAFQYIEECDETNNQAKALFP